MGSKGVETYFLVAFLILLLLVWGLMLKPYFGALVLASVFAVVTQPVYRRLLTWLKGQKSAAALATILLVLAIIFVPLIFLGIKIFQESANLYLAVLESRLVFVEKLERWLKFFNLAALGISINPVEYLRPAVSWLFNNLAAVFSRIADVLLTIILGTIGLYYMLKDGESFGSRLLSLVPLAPEYSQLIWQRFTATINAVVKGSLLVAMIQGILTGVGFWLFGVPNPAFWGMIAAFAALIPAVGTSLVIAPAVIYLGLVSGFFMAIGLLLWGVLAVGLIDNFLAPRLIGSGAKLHPFLILLSVLGGLALMGPVGFLAGPLVLSVTFASLDIYSLIRRGDDLI